MSLGASGPPATPKQVQYLAALLEKAGYPTWRDARRPLGLTQRQAGGKFTRREASDLIDRLLAAADGSDAGSGDSPGDGSGTGRDADAGPTPDEIHLANARQDLARGLPADVLADELRRRGWTVTPPV